MLRTLFLAALAACTVGDAYNDEDTAAEDQFLADVTPDTAQEDADFDLGDSGLDPATVETQPMPFGVTMYRNPVKDPQGAPMTCPDPSVVDAPRNGFRYFLVCTSDHDANSFPIRKSKDLVHWVNVGYVFPRGHHPSWAKTPETGGRYWAPEIYRIAGTWVVYFAANRHDGQMEIGVATATALRGPWSSHVLHHSGEFNAINDSHHQEVSGGVIDPSVQRGLDGNLYLYYCKQSNQIWGGRLSADGLTLHSDIQFLFGVNQGWEHDKQGNGVTEGPEPFLANGTYYLIYSGASTWDGSYALGVAASNNPLGPFTKHDGPILHSGRGFIAPGHSSHPVRGPNGQLYLLYHSLREPSHVSNDRKLMLDRFDFQGMWPIVHDGEPSSGAKVIP